MTKTIEVGAHVTDDSGHEYIYGGPLEREYGGSTLTFDMLHGGLPTINVNPHKVAPFPLEIDKKDPRIIVANDKAGRPGTWVGPWRAQVPGDKVPRWHKTKTQAVEHAARRLAIRAFWEATE